MLQQSDSKILKDLTFYVDDLDDDFTFYLDAASNAGSIIELSELLKRNATAKDDEKRFSVSEQITLTNLVPSKTSPRISDSFWSRLEKTTDEAANYLRGKLRVVAANDTERAIVRRLGGALSDDDRKSVAPLLLKALSPENMTDLKDQKWVSKLDLDPDLFDKLKDDKRNLKTLSRLLLERAFPELEWQKGTGRALICLSHAGKYLSVTVRLLKKQQLGYKAASLAKGRQKDREKYLFSVKEYCLPIYDQVFRETESTQNARGLLVVTGPTKSLKSEITRGLIDLYLREKREKGRKPHLVTFEDPIEMFYAYEDLKGQRCVALALRKRPPQVNYTPREKQKDAVSLQEALSDALRQTPSVFFVGETRSKEEWEVLLDFAATGHLIVTTAHAGSLVEAMHKIFSARAVETPADRNEIASKLLAVINLKPDRIEINDQGKSTEVVMPALWRRTARGVTALTSDGLSSLLPHRSSLNKPSCIGRRWFIEKLADGARRNLAQVFQPADLLEMRTKAYKQALRWDLQGV